MAKILLVEDDKSLREIYGVRLMAEGYEIVSAGDGEEALAMAIKERPNLIVSDVMMPKISGFDMLDILRSTSETKDVKVIMMTALSSDDQRARGEALGADRYLVKSQVGIEDVVRTVHDVLGDSIAAPTPAAPMFPASAPAAPVFDQPAPVTAPTPVISAPVAPEPVAQAAPVYTPDPTPAPAPVATPVYAPELTAVPVAQPAPQAFSQPATAAPVYTPDPIPAPVAQTAPAYEPVAAPAADPVYAPAPVVPVFEQQAPAATPVYTPDPVATPVAAPAPTTLSELPANPVPLPQPTAPFSTPAPASLGERIIEPLTNPTAAATAGDIASQMEQALNTQAPQNPGTPPVPPAV